MIELLTSTPLGVRNNRPFSRAKKPPSKNRSMQSLYSPSKVSPNRKVNSASETPAVLRRPIIINSEMQSSFDNGTTGCLDIGSLMYSRMSSVF